LYNIVAISRTIESKSSSNWKGAYINIHRSYVDLFLHTYTSIHTYRSRLIPDGVTEASQILLRDAHVLPKLPRNENYCRRDRWWIAVHLRWSAVNPLVDFYDIHGRKGEVLFYCSVPGTIRDIFYYLVKPFAV
jgi:hypothetical protein